MNKINLRKDQISRHNILTMNTESANQIEIHETEVEKVTETYVEAQANEEIEPNKETKKARKRSPHRDEEAQAL